MCLTFIQEFFNQFSTFATFCEFLEQKIGLLWIVKKNDLIAPIVKWVGGKRQLLGEIRPFLPKKITNYFEPFVGGGALFFELQPKKGLINDLNKELINVYRIVKERPDELISELKKHINDEDYFYQIRGLDRDGKLETMDNVQKASRILFLNKTCYNGLYRVNSQGEFNSPFGRYKNPNIVNETSIRAVSKYLNENNIQIHNEDYQFILKHIKKGDFVYLDPPYDPVSDSSNFTGYTQGGFGKKEQETLRDFCLTLDEIGVKFMLSNSATKFINDLYSEFKIEIIEASRSINSDPTGRGKVQEVLIRNYEQ